MRTHRLLAAAVAASMLALVTPTSAGAVTTVDATANNVTVKYDSCKRTTVTVTGDWTTDVSNEIQVTVRNPGGRVFDSATVVDDNLGTVTMSPRLCHDDRKGTYTVEVVAIGYDEFGVETSRVEDTTSFVYRHVPKVGSRIKHRVYYTPNQRTWKYQVPGKLLRNGRGYAGARVVLAAKVDGAWYAIDKQRTRRHGLFGWRFKPNNVRWAYYFAGNRSTKQDISDPFRTPNRARGKVLTGAQAKADTDLRTDLQDLVSRG